MKVLIWIGCFLGLAIIRMIAQNCGIILGGLPTALLFGTAWFIGKKLCDKWAMHQVEKKATEAGMTVSEYAKHGLSEEFLAKLEELCQTVPYEQVKSQLKACVKKGKITKEQYIILLEKYCNKK